jgi:hypothetical protein
VARHPLRRSQLVRPFGVGSMSTFPDGVSLMVAGLDHWFDGSGPGNHIDLDEFIVEEWRLERRLRVDHLRLPPDLRPARGARDRPNLDLTIPAVRFPEMHVCQRCSTLTQVPATERGRVRCPSCEADGRWGSLTQVQFVAMCEAGHIQDFPFREWVHRSVSPACHLPMRLYGSSGSSLVSVFVECGCTKRRNLAGITDAVGEGRTVLSHRLASREGPEQGDGYLCAGARPWLGRHDREGCDHPIRAGLRSASNTYFPSTAASVYVPREQAGVPADVAAKLELPPVSTWIRTLRDVGVEPTASQLRGKYPGLVPDPLEDAALDAWLRGEDGDGPELEDSSEEAFRVLEYEALSSPRSDRQLTVRQLPLDGYDSWLVDVVDRISLVERLRVTTAFTGFGRIGGDVDMTPEELGRRTQMLWADPPAGRSWLPASIVYGEGIFLRFDLDRLAAWESRPEVAERSGRLEDLYRRVTERRKVSDRDIPPRFVLLHTLAHLLIDQLAFEAGYSSTSLAERLYVSEHRKMAGILVYTAAGDSEGTLGGLVRLGRPGLLEPILRRAIDRSRWCSSDPVCSELAEAGGQGPDSCNLAACHDCAVLPETACEEFNRFLDRHLVSRADVGYLR